MRFPLQMCGSGQRGGAARLRVTAVHPWGALCTPAGWGPSCPRTPTSDPHFPQTLPVPRRENRHQVKES